MGLFLKPKWEQCVLGLVVIGSLALSSCDANKGTSSSGKSGKVRLADDAAPSSDQTTPNTTPPDNSDTAPADGTNTTPSYDMSNQPSDGTQSNTSGNQPTSMRSGKSSGSVTVAAGPYNFLGDPIERTGKPASSAPEKPGIPTSKVIARDMDAIAFFGELAPRNFRGSATYGLYINQTSRFKISGEYLTQKLNFDYPSGHRKKWVSQFAVGAEYQYLMNYVWFQSIELGTAYSHAFNHFLGYDEIENGTVKRRIAGSDGSLSFLGTTLKLWNCATLALAVDYDWVRFDRKYQNDRLSNGFGGSADFVQQFYKDFSLKLGAEFRQPFNSYRGILNWNRRFSKVNLDIGVFGNLTEGHDGVRDIRTVGLQLGISFGPKPVSCGRSFDLSSAGKDCYARQYCDVSQWVASPAVYVPVVLAIADQARQVTGCSAAPALISTPTQPFQATLGAGGTAEPTSFDTAQYFSGSGLTYSVSYDPLLLPAGNTISINPATGVLTVFNTGSGGPQNFFVTITASNSCGTASFTEQMTFQTP